MAIVRWNPLQGMLSLQDEMNRLFEASFFGEGATPSRGGKPIVWAPPIDVVESEDKVIVNAELPGMKAEDVELSVDDGLLTLKGERNFAEEVKEENLHRIERSYGYFERRIALPKTIDAENITASYNDGVLRIELPKVEATQSRQIKIKVEHPRVIEEIARFTGEIESCWAGPRARSNRKNQRQARFGDCVEEGGKMEDKEKDVKKQEQAHHRPLKKELEEEVKELEGEVEVLKEKLQASEEQSGGYLDDLKRLKAEFENYRKRMIREQTTIVETANQSMASKLLPVLDNLERAIAASDGEPGEGLADGVKMVHSQLLDVLKAEGLEEINPHGHPFDPHVCEAVRTVLSDDHADETVVEVHQKGYKWKDRLLRPAMATVSKCSSVGEQ